MNSRKVTLAVDVGGSHTRIRLEGPQRVQLRPVTEAASVRTAAGAIDMSALVDRIEHARGEAALPIGAIDTCTVGAASLGLVTSDPAPLTAWARAIRLRRLATTADATIAYLGGVGYGPGALIACGTGVIALGRGHDGAWRRADGWGHLLGDAGGGAWIGEHGLRAALRAADGRARASTALLAQVHARYGSPVELTRALYHHPNPARLLADFAPAVLQSAADGDDVAVRIRTAAVQHLADSATAALPADICTLTYVGGVFRAGPALTEPLERAVRQRRPDVETRPGHGDALDGACVLANRLADIHEPPPLPDLTVYDNNNGFRCPVTHTESLW